MLVNFHVARKIQRKRETGGPRRQRWGDNINELGNVSTGINSGAFLLLLTLYFKFQNAL
jgi:hypothetical protein